jgi:uncharacterized protein HemX
MATTEKAPPAPTRRDPSDILAKLDQLINERRDVDGKSKGWIATLIMAVLAIGGMAVFSWVKMRHGRELARLRHEKNKNAILARKATVDQRAASMRSEIVRFQKEVERLAENMRRIYADIRHEEALYEANNEAIDRIRSWRDVSAGHDVGPG